MCSPVDAEAVPEPWDMPGYQDPVIMAAGTFVSGASIELSADAPIRAPYIGYLQGALTYAHGRLGVEGAIARLLQRASFRCKHTGRQTPRFPNAMGKRGES